MSVHCDKCGQAKWLSKVFPKVEADLKTAHEMIREFREALEFYGDMNSYREKYYPDHQTQEKLGIPIFYEDIMGKRARAVLQKWQGKLNENT